MRENYGSMGSGGGDGLFNEVKTLKKRIVKVFRGRGYKRRASFTTVPFGKRVEKRRAANKVARASRKFNRQRAKGKR